MNSKGDMNPVSFLREELACDQLDVKINAVHRIPIVMELLDKPEQKKELENLIKKLILDTPLIDDEILYSLARVIEKLAHDGWEPWLELLESLAGKEETVVRTAAVNSIINIISRKPDSEKGFKHVLPLLTRLMPKFNTKEGGGDQASKNGKDNNANQCQLAWTNNVSGIEIIARIYQNYDYDDSASKLIELFVNATKTDNIAPMVMRAVIANLGDIVWFCLTGPESSNHSAIGKDVMTVLKDLVNNEQMVPHTNGLKNLLSITLKFLGTDPVQHFQAKEQDPAPKKNVYGIFGKNEINVYFNNIVGLFAYFVTSKDWKVRSHFAENLTDIMEVLKRIHMFSTREGKKQGPVTLEGNVVGWELNSKTGEAHSFLLSKFVDDCMGDQEGDVRQIAVANTAKLIEKFNDTTSTSEFLRLLNKHKSLTDNIPLVQVGGLEIIAALA